MIQKSKIESVISELKSVIEIGEEQTYIASKSNTILLLLPFIIEREFDSKDVSFFKTKKERYMKIKNTTIRFYKYESTELVMMIKKSLKSVIFYD